MGRKAPGDLRFKRSNLSSLPRPSIWIFGTSYLFLCWRQWHRKQSNIEKQCHARRETSTQHFKCWRRSSLADLWRRKWKHYFVDQIRNNCGFRPNWIEIVLRCDYSNSFAWKLSWDSSNTYEMPKMPPNASPPCHYVRFSRFYWHFEIMNRKMGY